MPITIKKPAKMAGDKPQIPADFKKQIATSTKLDTTDYTKETEDASGKTATPATKKAKEKLDVINLKYPEGTTKRVKAFYSSTGNSMTSGFLMSFELTVELLERGLISFSKGGYRINMGKDD